MGGQSARSNRSLRSKGSSKKIVIVPGSAKSRTSFSEAWGGTGMGSFRNNMSGKDFNNLAFASSQDNQSLQSATKKEGKAVRLPNGEIVRLNMPLVKRHSTIKNTASSQQPAALPATPASAKNMSPLSNINTSGIDMESVRRTPSGSPPQKQNSFREFSNIPMSRTTSFSSKQQPPPPTSAPPSRQASFSGASIKLGASISRNPSFSGKQQPPPPSGSPTHASLSRQQSTSGKSAFFQDNESISSVSNKRRKSIYTECLQ